MMPWRRRTLGLLVAIACGVAWASGPAAAADEPGQSVGLPRPLSGPLYEDAAGFQAGAVVAGSGSVRLAVWEDARTTDTSHTSIVATRLAADGTVLDPAGIVISDAQGQQSLPRISWSGSVFLVVWADNRAPYDTGTDIRGARVTPTGDVLDPAGIVIGQGTGTEQHAADWVPDVVWDGNRFLVSWRSEFRLGARVVHGDGSMGPPGSILANPTGNMPRLAAIGGRVLAVWSDSRAYPTDGWDIRARFLDPDAPGFGTDPDQLLVGGTGDQAVMGLVASADGGGVIAWIDHADGDQAITVGRLDETGSLLDPDGITVAGGFTGSPVAGTVMAPVSGGTLIAYAKVTVPTSDLEGRVLAPDGTLGAVVQLGATPEAEVPTGIGGDPLLVVGQTGSSVTNTGEASFVRPLDANGGPAGPQRVLATAAQEQSAPDIAATGAGWLTTWAERSIAGGWDIRVGRLDPDGTMMDGDGHLAASEAGNQRWPAVAWNGQRGVVVWLDEPTGGRIYARTIAADGDPTGSRVLVGEGAGDGTVPRIASDGNGFLVTWLEPDDEDALSIVRAQRLDALGARVGGVVDVSTTGRGTPDVAWLGDAYLVVWTGFVPPNELPVMGRRVLPGGTLGDAEAFQISSGGPATYADAPVIATGDGQALVAWQDLGATEVRSRLVGPDGRRLGTDDLSLAPAGLAMTRSAAAWNGQTYLVAWYGVGGGTELRIVASEIDRDGTIVGSAGRPLVDPQTTGMAAPSLDGGGGGRVGMVYERLVTGPPIGGSRRGEFRTIDVARSPVTGTSVTIAGGTAATRSTTVSVSVPATLATHVDLSNDGVDWRTMPYAPVVQWSLTDPAYGGTSAPGPKTVHVRWRDLAGIWSSPKTDSIILDTVAPTVTAPGATFVVGSRVRTASVSVKVRWTGADAGSGIARYELAQSRDGGAWTTVATALTTSSTTRSIAANRSWRFRVRAIDGAGNVGAWVGASAIDLRGNSEASSLVSYTGRWARGASDDYWGGALRYSRTRGYSVTYRFTGRSVAWVSTLASNRGSARVYLDGRYVTTVDLRRATAARRSIVYARSWATSRAHVLRIVVVGTSGRPRVDVDGFLRW